mmetsp:Transcript_22739/g.40903  ORF Transcript_22739/g.40903 Transcript_22739/m.40903 type:complete len:156 (-) Transcript_22739:39-506(-)
MPSWQLSLDRSKEIVPDPLGFKTTIEISGKRKQKNVKMNKAWEIANSPLKSMFTTVMMLYFSGSQLGIFPIMITSAAMWTPIKSILTYNSVFSPYESPDVSLFLPKCQYLLLQLIMLSFGLYKFSMMGLIPVAAEDWIALVPLARPVEIATGVIA